MKKVLYVALTILLTLCVSGCSNRDLLNQNSVNQNSVSQNTESQAENNTTQENETPSLDNVEIDLSQFTGDELYNRVSDMMSNPNEHIGKVVKISAPFGVLEATPANPRNYFGCICFDNDQCHMAVLEFVCADDLQYPDDYPKTGENITVVGVFNTYLEAHATFCQLENAIMVQE